MNATATAPRDLSKRAHSFACASDGKLDFLSNSAVCYSERERVHTVEGSGATFLMTGFQRIGLAIVACTLIALGWGALQNGALNYRNYWGGLVFAPFGLLIGIYALFLVFRPKVFEEDHRKRARIRGWPAGCPRR